MPPRQRVKKVRDFFARYKRHIFCENKFSRKISLRSSKSLMAQAFLMAIIQLEAGLAPSSSPAARLYLIGSMVFDSLGRGGYAAAPFVLFLESMPGNYFMQRQMRVTICARVQMPSGSKVTALVPLVTPALTAHSTAVS